MKISLFTTCKGRLDYLRRTLPANVRNAHPNIELVILNYGSTDQMDAWMKANFRAEIEAGTIAYYRSAGQTYYDSAHSKNCGARLSTGDVVCNIDADNFAEREFQDYLFEKFSDPALDMLFNLHVDGRTGRLALRKRSFEKVGGHNEEMKGYGSDDVDLRDRVTASRMKVLAGRLELYEAIHNQSKAGDYVLADTIESDRRNQEMMVKNIRAGRLVANQGKHWGHIIAQKNWQEYVET